MNIRKCAELVEKLGLKDSSAPKLKLYFVVMDPAFEQFKKQDFKNPAVKDKQSEEKK